MTEDVLLLAIKPRWVDPILDGLKVVELRRNRPPIGAGSQVILYASRPTSALVAVCVVSSVRTLPLDVLWSATAGASHCTRDEFDRYFQGATEGTAIRLKDPRRILPVGLATMRQEISAGVPPQSFRVIPRAKVEHLIALV